MAKKVGFVSPARVWVISAHTFTQLVRMKVFYFLIIFAAVVIGVNFFELPGTGAVAQNEEQQLRMMKGASLFAMETFAWIFGVAATALLIPKDVEDRTLYTILCKPVPRLDYLFGKLMGVLMVIAAAVVVMDLLLCVALHFRAEGLLEQALFVQERAVMRAAQGAPVDPNILQQILQRREDELMAHGVTLNLQWGVLAVFLKASVIAGVALLLSTFSTSTLFTIIVSTIVFFMGHGQADAREWYLESVEGGKVMVKFLTGIVSVILPDFQVFGITEAAVEAREIPRMTVVKLLVLSMVYFCIYVVLSWFVFRKKEF